MAMRRLSLYSLLVAILVLSVTVISGESVAAQGDDGDVLIRISSGVETPTITAKPSETVSVSVPVKVEVLNSNGIVETRIENVTLTLTNSADSQNSDALLALKTCSADLNFGERLFNGAVRWDYNYSTSSGVSHWANVHAIASGGSPYWTTQSYSGGFGTPSYGLTAYNEGSFLYTRTIVWEYHRLNWTLYANGDCAVWGQVW